MSSRGDSRRYPTAEVYEERERDFYRSGRRGTREYDELDVDISRGRGAPEFLREDYGRNTNAGQLVVRETPPARPREVERDEIIITREERERARPPPRSPRSFEREEVEIRRGDRHRREAEKEDIDITIEHDHGPSAPRRRHRRHEVERDEIQVRHSEVDLTRSGRGRDEFDGRRGDDPRQHRGEVDKEEIIIRRDERIGRRHGGTEERERISVRARSQSRRRHESLPPPRDLVARETEEFVIRRKKPRSPSPSPSPSPPPPRRNFEREEIIIRRTEERSPTPPPPPPPEPEPVVLQPIIRPPIHQEIHQEIITHHRHIDHGVERARSPTPSPPPRTPSPPKVDTLEIDIRRRRNGRGEFEEDITVERDRLGGGDREVAALRSRSRSTARRRHYDDKLEEEADYYNRKAMERAYVGEAYNGATRDWSIVDVPPGTERVKMDGAGGSSQEISWQRYNGVRRSKFLAGDREFDSGFGMPDHRAHAPPLASLGPPARIRPSDMWTEITKDLVIKEAIQAQGYQFEETEFFYYVMEYLRYEDVLQLVEISDEIRRDRRRRLREIEWEREEMRHRHAQYDERFYEHEVIVDSRRRH